MTKTLPACFRLRRLSAALLIVGGAWAVVPLHAQETVPAAAAARNNPAVATDGATLIHGNYCGAGNRPGKPPIDALDLACMNHDACTPTGGIPTCDCNARLRDEAAAVSQDPRQAPELRSLAALTSAAASAMVCKPMLNAATTPAPVMPAPVTQAPAQAPVAAAPVMTESRETAPVASAPMSIVPPAAAVPAAEDAQAAAEPRPRSLP